MIERVKAYSMIDSGEMWVLSNIQIAWGSYKVLIYFTCKPGVEAQWDSSSYGTGLIRQVGPGRTQAQQQTLGCSEDEVTWLSIGLIRLVMACYLGLYMVQR